MIRIIQENENPTEVALRIEGRIVASSLGALERDCDRCLQAGKRIRLDLSRVTYVDACGAAALVRMMEGGAEIANQSALIRDLLEETRG
jgi:anti-anti-sigma regulatory factor